MLFTEQRRGLRPHKLFRLFKPKFNGDLLIAYYKKIRNAQKGYVKIDVTDLIRDWKVNGVENSSMIVEIDRNTDTLNSVHTRKRRDIGEDEWLRKRPMLTVYTVSANNIRKKRSRRNVVNGNIYIKASEMKRLNETHQKVKRETCRLRPYSLNFKDFGWDEWIIAPNSYDLNFCSGMCPRPLGPHFNTTNHAVIQNAVLGINKQLVPPLCCVPTTFKDQTFLFLDNNGKLLLKTPVEMIAQGCGCH
jgi:TGF-beta propeptide./Transforming growth factor beta like domain.